MATALNSAGLSVTAASLQAVTAHALSSQPQWAAATSASHADVRVPYADWLRGVLSGADDEARRRGRRAPYVAD